MTAIGFEKQEQPPQPFTQAESAHPKSGLLTPGSIFHTTLAPDISISKVVWISKSTHETKFNFQIVVSASHGYQ
jgi:hypothetical protein